MLKLKINTDGGARGNPGPAGIGVVIVDADTGEMIEEHAKYLGETTNNQAEYKAVILGLTRAVKLGASDVEILSDSELLIKQANMEYKVKNPEIAKRFLEMKNLCTQIGRCKFRHVRREQNTRADFLSNVAMDQGGRNDE
ncbi:MAG: ribonuclease HI family protein [Patescibacteria group bacterium]|nr:ribonuclease HI family protein [Patescibacteria group bacterium]